MTPVVARLLARKLGLEIHGLGSTDLFEVESKVYEVLMNSSEVEHG